jgi:hypothetical protein
MKGKSSIWIAQNVDRKMRNFLGHKFWARGCFVTTVGQQLDQLELKISAIPKSKPQASLAFYSRVVRGHFGLESDRKIVCGISFGIANTEHPANGFRTNRAEVADVVSFVGD